MRTVNTRFAKETEAISGRMSRCRVSKIKLHGEMRELWHDHVALTREYLLKAAANQPSAKPTLRRLLHNQDDIGNAFKPYYGTANGNQLTALLKEHIAIAGKIVERGKKAPLPSALCQEEGNP